MKASASLLLLFLIVAGCSDTTTNPTGLTPPGSVARDAEGNEPPPPVDVAVAVCTDGGCAVFDGLYMSNTDGDALAEGFTPLAPDEAGVCVFPGHAFLKINDQIEPQLSDAETSSNAQVKCSQGRATGGGVIEINGVEVRLDQVLTFENSPDCVGICGGFTARDEDGDVARGNIIEREFFEEECENVEGGPACFPEEIIT